MLTLIFAIIAALDPNGSHDTLAAAVERVVASEPPLFKGDDDRSKTTALVLAVAFREGSFRLDAVGDKGRSVCTMQIHNGSRELLTDPDACIRTGLNMLRESLRVCPAHPVAWYAEGPRGCTSPRAQRISRDRMALARWALAKAVSQ